MKNKILELYTKYREVIQYLIFGVLTTIVNFVVFFVLRSIYTDDSLKGLFNVIANIVAILFAYITNKLFVFQSKKKGFKNLIIEMGSFFACRALTLLNDVFVFWLGFYVLGIPDLIVKLIGQVIIVVLNYILSKLVVFRKKKNKDNTKEEISEN